MSKHAKIGLFILVMILLNCSIASEDNKTRAQDMNKKVKKILFIGDSISEGHSASDKSKRYTTLVVDGLNEKGEEFEEINIAVSGSSLVEHPWPKQGFSGMPYKLEEAISHKPDIVVIQHGVNDNAIGSSVFEFLWNYRVMVQTLKEKLPNVKIVCMTICPSWISIECWVSDPNWVNRVNVGIQEIAARENTMIAQTNFMLQNRKELFNDGVHPNNEGHRILADSVLNALRADKKQSIDNFDVVVDGCGQFRICGYIFQITPTASEKTSGFSGFYNLTKDGFDYKGDFNIKMISPVKQYSHDVKIKSDLHDRDSVVLLWEEYCGRLTLKLKPNDEKVEVRFETK